MKDLLKIDKADYTETNHESDFLRMVRDHKEYLTNLTSTEKVPLEPADSYRWRGDFNGLLNSLGIPIDVRVPMCIINNLGSFSDWTGELDIVIVVQPIEIGKLLTKYRTSQR